MQINNKKIIRRTTLSLIPALYFSVFMFVHGMPAVAFASEDAEKEDFFKKKTKVILLPVKDFRLSENEIFLQDNPVEKAGKINKKIIDAVISSLQFEKEIELVSSEELSKKFLIKENRKETEIIVRGFLHLGEELYKNLQVKEASANLEKGKQLALDLYVDVFEPQIFADIMFYLGLSYLEMGRTAEAHIALKMMYFVDPERKFIRNYFPKPVEEALQHALLDFVQTHNKEMAMLSLERMDKFLSDSGFDEVIYTYVDNGKEGSLTDVAHILIYEKKSHAFTYNGDFPVIAENNIVKTEDLSERVGRSISQWKACVTVESGKPEEEKQKIFFLDVGGAHSIYTKFPTRYIFNNLGFSTNFSAKLRRNFDIFAKAHFLTSIPDKYGDLINNFNSLRLVAGAGFEFSSKLWRVFFHPGIDIHYIGMLEKSNDPYCKWDRHHPLCTDDRISVIDSQVFVGIHAAIGVNIIVLEDLYIAMQAGFSAYFYPFRESIPLNFPVSFDAGIGYSF
jgi:hypothetical protein